ncbi:MAG: hypothetical protein B7Z75_00080 [Acidocella sp. 20-57-95]|nr:MAG: hypothetical protein B7Z75_00080 [Acidocella sp. 20-57-95]OYV60897.1 MAG: hypothetical protein B7Z71_05490 [Acidocella sp. 21-58-7]HQT63368.1 cell division protein FtsQ/DivIB [Acidocella sp.]HQU03220.1 cell division protein FtsQ/DivIB [Acidocella sp.]
MSRLASPQPLRASSSRPAAKAKPKKQSGPQDRLKARTLFFRRVKRSLQPGLWVLGSIFVVALLVQLSHKIPKAAPVNVAPTASSSMFARFAASLGFRVVNIQITGADSTSPQAILEALGTAKGAPIFGVALDQAAARIAQLGPVQSAVIERELPGTLLVSITGRAPYAIWQTSLNGTTKFVLIDKAGDVIPDQDAAAAKHHNPALVLLVGNGAPQHAAALMADLANAPFIMSRLAAAEWVDGLRWNLVLQDHAVVKLPADDEQTALAQLGKLQNTMALLDRPVEAIDMRRPDRLVVQPFPKDAVAPAVKSADHT